MNLLIFSYLLALFLFSFSYYLDARSEKTTSLFTSISMTAAFVSLFSGLGANLLYTGNVTIGVLAVRVALLCFAILSFSLMKFVPRFRIKPEYLLNFLYWVFIAYCIWFSSRYRDYVPTKITLWSGLVMGTCPSPLYAVIFVYGIPGLTVFSLVVGHWGFAAAFTSNGCCWLPSPFLPLRRPGSFSSFHTCTAGPFHSSALRC